jgi:hypothetical protein
MQLLVTRRSSLVDQLDRGIVVHLHGRKWQKNMSAAEPSVEQIKLLPS